MAWTDVKQMFIVVGGMSAAVVDPAARHPAATSASARRCIWPARPAGCRRSTSRFDLQRDLHVLVGDDRRAVPDAVVLRLRPEPGAALPDREVDRRGAPVAADERVRQDSAAAADPRRPACSCSSSTCSRRRRCCSTASTTRRSRPARTRRSTRRSQQAVRRGDRRRAAQAAERDDRDAFLASDARVQRHPRAAPSAIVKQTTGDAALHRRQLRVSDLHHDAACRSAWSA